MNMKVKKAKIISVNPGDNDTIVLKLQGADTTFIGGGDHMFTFDLTVQAKWPLLKDIKIGEYFSITLEHSPQ